MNKFVSELERVITDTRPAMLSAARLRIGNNDAEDVVQETILGAYEAGVDVTKPYLLELLDKVCKRVQARRRRSRDVSIEGMEDTPAPQAATGLKEEALAQLAAASHLTDLQRTCLLARIEGYSTAEIAAQLCITSRMVLYHCEAAGPKLQKMNVHDLGFSSSQALYDYCAHQHIYRPPLKTGSALSNERQARLR